MTYICFFFVLYWFALSLKFGPLSSKNPRCAPVLYRVSLSKGLSFSMQFGKECNYFRVIFLFFFWQFITNKRMSCSEDCILLFFIIFLFTYLIPYSVFCLMFFFYSNKILLIADILQILKF